MNNPTLRQSDDSASTASGCGSHSGAGKAAGVCRKHAGRRFLSDLTGLQLCFVETAVSGATLGAAMTFGAAVIAAHKPHMMKVAFICAATISGCLAWTSLRSAWRRMIAYEATTDFRMRAATAVIASFRGKARGHALPHAGTPTPRSQKEQNGLGVGVVRQNGEAR